MSGMHGYQHRISHQQEHSRRSAEGAVFIAVWIGTSYLYQSVAGLGVVAGLVLSFATAFVAGIAFLVIRDTLPLPVPPELAEDYLKLSRDGWRKAWVHPWWRCEEQLPHTHLVHRDDHCSLVLSWAGCRASPDTLN